MGWRPPAHRCRPHCMASYLSWQNTRITMLRAYGNALMDLGASIRSKTRATADETLATMSLLATYEVCYLFSISRVVSLQVSCTSWSISSLSLPYLVFKHFHSTYPSDDCRRTTLWRDTSRALSRPIRNSQNARRHPTFFSWRT